MYGMKNIYRLLLLCFFLSFSACAGDGDIHGEEAEEPVDVLLAGLEDDINPEGEIRKLSLTVKGAWKLSEESSWLSLDKTEGEGRCDVTLKIEPNDDGIVRMAELVFEYMENGGSASVSYELMQSEPWITRQRVGDPDAAFDMTRMDARYPQIQEWISAGKTGGIPYLEDQLGEVDKVFDAGTACSEIKAYLESVKYNKTVVLLKSGEYVFDQSVRLYSNATLIGEDKDGVVIKLRDKGNISMYGGKNVGLRNVTLRGDYSEVPPTPGLMEDVLPELGKHRSIDMSKTRECFVDNVRIVNSASHPVWLADNGEQPGHNTLRDLDIDGAYNKGGGCEGYLFFCGSYNLATGCKVVNLRHISMQGSTVKYNVFYKNNVNQEVSFHTDDGGDNLVEHNRITIPKALSHYNAIMGPWSVQHKVGGLNFIYRNRCLEENKDDNRPWSDNELYIGPHAVVSANSPECYTNFRVMDEYPKPLGRTFYPVVLK